MFITLYTPIGIVYQKFTINETDIIYCDLLKYIDIHKNELYDELNESEIIFDEVFIKTIINLFHYNQINNNEKYEEFCKLAVKRHCYLLKYIKKQTYEICKLAIKQTYYALACVKEQTDEICKLAVQQNGNELRYVKEQTDEIRKLALLENQNALRYVKEEFRTPELLKKIE